MEQDRIAARASRSPSCFSSRPPRRFSSSAPLVALLLVLILALAGCGSSKLSADQTAEKLGAFISSTYHVQCSPASGSFWDYACTVTPPPGSKEKAYRLKVQVGPHEILQKAYCGAGATGAPLKC